MALAEELGEGGKEIGFDEAGEDFGGVEVELEGGFGVAFQGLDGVDCFDAQDSPFHQRPAVAPWPAAADGEAPPPRGGGGWKEGEGEVGVER